MMEWARESLGKVENSRSSRMEESPKAFTDVEVKSLLNEFHPDYSGKERAVRIGSTDSTQTFPLELADLLESDSPLPESHDVSRVDIETDVLIIGGGRGRDISGFNTSVIRVECPFGDKTQVRGFKYDHGGGRNSIIPWSR